MTRNKNRTMTRIWDKDDEQHLACLRVRREVQLLPRGLFFMVSSVCCLRRICLRTPTSSSSTLCFSPVQQVNFSSATFNYSTSTSMNRSTSTSTSNTKHR